MIYGFIHAHRFAHAVERMCRVLGVRRSGYYAWKRRGQSRRARRDAELLGKIRESHGLSKGRYGSPNIHEDLRDWGYRCGRKRVARLMRESGLRSKVVRRFRVTTQSKHKLPVAENLLARDFTASAPNRVWVSDITYLWTQQGWLYLCVILDLWDRKVVGWSMGERLVADLAVDALRKAVRLRRPPEGRLVFHSDRGVQYASEAFRAELRRCKMLQSMSRKGDCWDNAVAESFFSILKRELVYHEIYRTRAEARLSVFQYIEGWYNRKRRHSTLGRMSPLAFEQAAKAA
jgi:transposase InsO family protein